MYSKKLRYLLRLLSAFVSRFKALILIGFLLGILIFLLLNFIIPRLFSQKNYRIGIAGRYFPETLPDVILNKISGGLTSINDGFEIEPNIAYSWSTPDKGITWIFELSDDKRWQDESVIKSTDLNYTFSDVIIEYPDEKSIIFKLKEAYTPFPSVLSEPLFKTGLLGYKDMKVASLRITGNYVSELVLESSDIKEHYKFYPTEERLKLAMKLGQVDIIQNLITPSPFNDWHNLDISSEVNENQIVTIFFNTKDPILSDKTIRQALSYAIKKDNFDGTRALTPIQPKSWAYNSQVKEYPYNPERSKEILSELPSEVRESIDIKLVSSPVLLFLAEQIVNDWNEVGVKSSVLVSSNIPNDFSAYLAIFEPPKDPDQYSIWHSTQTSTNISSYSNPRIDKLLEDGRVEIDLEERRKIYLDFQRFILEDLPAIFLYHPKNYTVTRK